MLIFVCICIGTGDGVGGDATGGMEEGGGPDVDLFHSKKKFAPNWE